MTWRGGHTATRLLGTGLLLLFGCAPCAAEPGPGSSHSAAPSLPLPERPADCRELPPGADLQAAIDAAPDHAAICLAPGAYEGPLALARGLTLWGPRGAVVRSSGNGTTIRVTGTGVRLAGFTIDGSGGRYDLLDAAIHVTGDGHVVEGVQVVNATYGILVERAQRATVRHNLVDGDAHKPFGLRGDPIRLWETTDSVVSGNHVSDGRDVVVWYSSRNRIVDNQVRGGRYGTHLMYSHDNLVEHNLYEGGVVGVFVMYSRRVTLRGNVIAGAKGSAGIGVGLKDSGDVRVEGNRLVADAVGIFIDNSPSQQGEHVWARGNELRLCDSAVVFHGSGERNVFQANSFADNQVQVRSDGGGDARAVAWEGNYFDDYAGYDLDGDGIGDVAYELRSATGELVGHHPELAFFHGTPTLGLAEAASRMVPLLAPGLLLVDARPRMAPMTVEETTHAH